MTDIAKLKAAAEKATPGPWRRAVTIFNGITCGPFSLTNEKVLANVAEKANAEFIAAANPAAVLELIAQNDALVAAHVNLKLLADTYRQAYEEARARIAELEARTVTVELPRGYAGPYGSLVYDADAVEAALEAAERQKGYLREQCNEWERKAISNFENCSEMAARIEELESQRKMAFMASNRWADKFREAEKRIAELEARTLTVKLPEAATEGGRGYRKKAIWALQEACFDAGINLETGGE